MSLFTVGKRYQGEYLVEHVVSFFNGELAISQFLDERYYLQSVPLVREFTTLEFHRFKKLYDELDLELLLPVSDMFLEGNYAVFVYPYEPIQPIRDVIVGVSDDQIIQWFHKIIQTEIALQSMGIPMYIIRDPRNIGLNTEGEIRVIFSAIEDVTLYESTINWGTFLYCIASGEYVDESMKRLPSKHSISRPVARIIQKSFRAKNLQDLYSIVDQALNKRKGGGLIESIFGKRKTKEPSNETTVQLSKESFMIDSPQDPDPLSDETQKQTTEKEMDQPATFDWSHPLDQPPNQGNPAPQSAQLTEPDPFEQQLEQMYQSIEQESQPNTMEETQIYTKQDQNTGSTSQQPMDESQPFMSQMSDSKPANIAQEEVPIDPPSNPNEPQGPSQGFVRKSSQEMVSNVNETDDTQIFSASDLASLEAELEALQQERESVQLEKTKQEQAQQEQSAIQTPADELSQLEALFGEYEQLQQDDQTTMVVNPSIATEKLDMKNELAEELGTETVNDQPTVQEVSSASNLDHKVRELESLFDELNQIQSKENKVTSDKETTVASVVEPQQEVTEEAKEEKKKQKETQSLTDKRKASPQEEPEKEPQEEDPLEKIRREFEQEQKALLERQRKKLQERQQALINEVQEELKKRQQELLEEMEQQEEEMIAQLEAEFQKRKLREMRKMELNTLRKKHDQDVETGLEEIRREYEELEKLKLEELDQEFVRRKQEIVRKLSAERLERESEFKAQKDKEWEVMLKKFKEEEETDEDYQAENSADGNQTPIEKTHDLTDQEKKSRPSKKASRKTEKSQKKNRDAEKKKRLQVKKEKEGKKHHVEMVPQVDERKEESAVSAEDHTTP